MKFRKLPVTIEAITFEDLEAHANGAWSFAYNGHTVTQESADCYLILTLEGTMRFERGRHMLITGVKGEVYPCQLDIFTATYEPVPA